MVVVVVVGLGVQIGDKGDVSVCLDAVEEGEW